MTPGEILFGAGPIVANAGRPTVDVTVHNASRHTIFVSSHYPFFEVNRHLRDIPAGDALRWGPGETKTVRLVAYGGRRAIRGFHGLTDGPATPERLGEALRRAEAWSPAGETPHAP